MAAVRTLEDRRKDAVMAIRSGVERLEPRLRDFARRRGGRFILFGSSVTGPLHDRSDIDLIADFPEPVVFRACRFADEVCDELGLTPDVRPLIWVAPRVLRRALETGRFLS